MNTQPTPTLDALIFALLLCTEAERREILRRTIEEARKAGVSEAFLVRLLETIRTQ